MKRKIYISFILLVISMLGFAQGSLTPAQILDKTVKTMMNGKGIEANFTVSNSGYTGKGEIRANGTKFNVVLPEVEVWYDGKDLYTYNKNTQETTIVVPSIEELAQSNPLAYISNAPKKYNVKFSTVKKDGRYVLELTPKTKDEIKRITLTVKKNDYLPEKIVVEPASGTPVSAEISSFKTNVIINDTRFIYPKSKYPKAEIIDLR